MASNDINWSLWIVIGVGVGISLLLFWRRFNQKVGEGMVTKFEEVATQLEEMQTEWSQRLQEGERDGRLGEKHLRLLTAQDFADVLGPGIYRRQVASEAGERSATVRFVPPGDMFERALYHVERVTDVAADREARRTKAAIDAGGLSDLSWPEAGGFRYDMAGRGEAEAHVVVFWNEPESLRISLCAYDVTAQEAEELARRMAGRLVSPLEQPGSGSAEPAASVSPAGNSAVSPG